MKITITITKEVCFALAIGLAIGISVGWFVRSSNDQEVGTGNAAVNRILDDKDQSWEEFYDAVGKLPPLELSYEEAIENKRKFEAHQNKKTGGAR